MNRAILWLGSAISCAAFFTAVAGRPPGRALLPPPRKTGACAAPAYHQLDFWIGDWDAFDVDKPMVVVARNRVDRILDGCVLREDYRGADGTEGQSFSVYDASRNVWHQTWVTNRGRLLLIEGNFRDGQMALSGVDRTASGKERHLRGVWKPVKGGVRETAWTSMDGGKTWKPWFDILFRPHIKGSRTHAFLGNGRKQSHP